MPRFDVRDTLNREAVGLRSLVPSDQASRRNVSKQEMYHCVVVGARVEEVVSAQPLDNLRFSRIPKIANGDAAALPEVR